MISRHRIGHEWLLRFAGQGATALGFIDPAERPEVAPAIILDRHGEGRLTRASPPFGGIQWTKALGWRSAQPAKHGFPFGAIEEAPPQHRSGGVGGKFAECRNRRRLVAL